MKITDPNLFKTKEAKAFLLANEFFECKRLKCLMRKSVCVMQQEKTQHWEKEKWKSVSCFKCEQGEKIMSEVKNSATDEKKTKRIKKWVVDEDISEVTKKCQNPECGKTIKRKKHINDYLWARKRFCSKTCQRKAAKLKRDQEKLKKNKQVEKKNNIIEETRSKINKKSDVKTLEHLIKIAELNGCDLIKNKKVIAYIEFAYELGRKAA